MAEGAEVLLRGDAADFLDQIRRFDGCAAVISFAFGAAYFERAEADPLEYPGLIRLQGLLRASLDAPIFGLEVDRWDLPGCHGHATFIGYQASATRSPHWTLVIEHGVGGLRLQAGKVTPLPDEPQRAANLSLNLRVSAGSLSVRITAP